MLKFPIQLRAGTPIYEQVVFAVKKAIVFQHLKAGDSFPSVREISKELRINPNTAQKVITTLVHENLLEVKPGIGTVVQALPAATESQRQAILGTELERLIVEARRLSISKQELFEAISQHWSLGGGNGNE